MNRSGLVTGVVAVAMALSACSSKGGADGASGAYSASSDAVRSAKVVTLPRVNLRDIPFANSNRDAGYFNGNDSAILSAGSQLDLSPLGMGFNQVPMNYNVKDYKGSSYRVRGEIRVYNQPYSIVYGHQYDDVSRYFSYSDLLTQTGKTSIANNKFVVHTAQGYRTPSSQMPKSGTATYTGKGFTGYGGAGDFRYLVDFDKRQGEGEITGLADVGYVHLTRGNISQVRMADQTMQGVNARATVGDKSAYYTLGFFGPNAEEVAGFVHDTPYSTTISNSVDGEIGFGGSRK